MSALDTQVGGDHYKHLAIQPMEYSMKNGLDACQHTAIKYITRFREKGGIADLEKAKHCIDMLIEFEQQRVSPAERRIEEAIEAFTAPDHPHAPPVRCPGDPFGPRDADGWYTWNGDDTMRPAGRVEYRMRSGSGTEADAESLRWDHRGRSGDIVRWRPAPDERPPKRWEVGTRLRRTTESSPWFTQGKEYEIVKMAANGLFKLIDDTGEEHSWAEGEARQRFERA